jgi:hypothetical protein
MFNKIFETKLSDTLSINTFINNREIWKNLQSQIDEVNKTLTSIKEIKSLHDAKILELDDKIKFHDDYFKYKLWSCTKYHEDRHIPVNDFIKLLGMNMVKNNPDGCEFTSLFLTNGYDYFNGKDGWISKLSSHDYYRVAKTVRQYKSIRDHLSFDNLIISDIYEAEHDCYNYLRLLEKLHIQYSNKNLTDERFEIRRKTLLLLKEDGLLN